MARDFEHTAINPLILSGKMADLECPLASDPGTRWGYGLGMDWLGLIIEAIDGRRIATFCQEEIFDPLGMSSTKFEADDLLDRLATSYGRSDDGSFIPIDMPVPPTRPEFYGMGHAIYSTADDYIRFLRLVLNRGALDGVRLVSEQTIDAMLTDQLDDLSFRPMVSCAPLESADFDPFPGIRCGHSIAFLCNSDDVPGKRLAGSQTWAGCLNTFFWIDPKADLCAVMLTQSVPFADPRVMKTYDLFERAVYDAESSRP